MDALIDSLYPIKAKGKLSEEDKKYLSEEDRENLEENNRKKDEVRKYIYVLFLRDFDFIQPKHAQFDIAALQEWIDYKQGLVGSDWIIDKYFQSLAAYRRQNPGVLENIQITANGEPQELNMIVGDPLKSMFEGFACHRDLLSQEAEKDRVISELMKVTGNVSLSGDLRDFKCPKIEVMPKSPSN